MIIDLNRSRDKLEFSVLNHLNGEMIYELLVYKCYTISELYMILLRPRNKIIYYANAPINTVDTVWIL